jgi:uncharacterized membrane protein
MFTDPSGTPIRELTAAARAGLSGCWGKSIGLMLIYLFLLAGLNRVPVAGGWLQLIFAAPLTVGLHIYFLAVVRGRPHSTGQLFEGFARFGTSWCAYMLVLLIILMWMIPFGILMALVFFFVHPDPGIFPVYTIWAVQVLILLSLCGFLILLQMRYYLVLYRIADDPPVHARQAIRRSVELMKGNYWRLGLLWLRFIGWQLLCVLTLGIGLIWLIPYMSAATAAFYDDLTANEALRVQGSETAMLEFDAVC